MYSDVFEHPQIREVKTVNIALLAQSGGITSLFQLDRGEYGVSAMFDLGNRANTERTGAHADGTLIDSIADVKHQLNNS